MFVCVFLHVWRGYRTVTVNFINGLYVCICMNMCMNTCVGHVCVRECVCWPGFLYIYDICGYKDTFIYTHLLPKACHNSDKAH